MKKSLKLSAIQLSSFTTNLEAEASLNAKGGQTQICTAPPTIFLCKTKQGCPIISCFCSVRCQVNA